MKDMNKIDYAQAYNNIQSIITMNNRIDYWTSIGTILFSVTEFISLIGFLTISGILLTTSITDWSDQQITIYYIFHTINLVSFIILYVIILILLLTGISKLSRGKLLSCVFSTMIVIAWIYLSFLTLSVYIVIGLMLFVIISWILTIVRTILFCAN